LIGSGVAQDPGYQGVNEPIGSTRGSFPDAPAHSLDPWVSGIETPGDNQLGGNHDTNAEDDETASKLR
jgi:hypothetical protein